MKTYADSQLVLLYQQGQEAALETLVSRYQAEIYHYIYYKVMDHDLANDLFQDTFIKVILTLKKKRYNEEGKFVLWVRRIAQNLIIDHFRAQTRRSVVSEGVGTGEEAYSLFDFLPCTDPTAEDRLVREQVNQDLHTLIQQLSPVQQQVLRMRFFEGLSFREIAEQTGCSINTTLGRVRYAVMNLRKLMEENNISLQL